MGKMGEVGDSGRQKLPVTTLKGLGDKRHGKGNIVSGTVTASCGNRWEQHLRGAQHNA